MTPEFRSAWLAAVAHANGKTPLEVEQAWEQYCRDCQSADQSPLRLEFLSWYGYDVPRKVVTRAR